MDATALYKAGKLREAIEAQLQQVKASPADHGKRLFLFELAAFSGDLDRAKRQIEALTFDDPDLERARIGYRKLIDAEEARRRFFREGVRPEMLANTPEHVSLRLQAIDRLRESNAAEAGSLIQKANESLPHLKGQLNGKPFDGIRDFDDLFGTVLEVFAAGKYVWVPLEQISAIAINAPRYPRDLLWTPAKLVTNTGEEADVFLPALYPNTHEHKDDMVRLGRSTDWSEGDDAPVRGSGLRTFLVGEDPVPLLEWREMIINPIEPAA